VVTSFHSRVFFEDCGYKISENKIYERRTTMKNLQLTHVGRDSWERPVYECDGKLYVDTDPRKHLSPNICTKANNEFDGEPDSPINVDIEVIFIPARDTW
jgi:hypothetical protein